MAAGDYHSMVLMNDRNLWATGSNLYGQLGDETTIGKAAGRNVFTKVALADDGACSTIP